MRELTFVMKIYKHIVYIFIAQKKISLFKLRYVCLDACVWLFLTLGSQIVPFSEELRSTRSIVKEAQGKNHKNRDSFSVYCSHKVLVILLPTVT